MNDPKQKRFQLPIDDLLPEVVASLRRCPNLVIEAAPGAGKTTRVPPALLDLVNGEVLVLEPRRIAARLAARRVAAELGEEVGGTVGYQVRFEEASGPRTRLRFVTEGVLTRRLLRDPELGGVDAVVLDEFHERHLDTDLALALLRRLQKRRAELGLPALRLVVMSATLEAGPVARFLGDGVQVGSVEALAGGGDGVQVGSVGKSAFPAGVQVGSVDGLPAREPAGCPVLRSAGRAFPLRVEHLPYSPQPLEMQVRAAVETALREERDGHVLVFLPGAAEIRRAQRACEEMEARFGAVVLPLYGELTPAEQDRAVGPAPRGERKVILATNVAESSVTIEGVRAVVDSGLARFASFSPWTGLPTLEVQRVSRASATQRAGRAGRTGPGRVLRLFSAEDFGQRPEHDVPEILRSDLAGLCLSLRAMGLDGVRGLRWLDPPPEAAVVAAEDLLDRLGARGEMAERLTRFPLPPRLARMLVEAAERGAGEAGVRAAALLGSGVRPARQDLLSALDAPPEPRVEQGERQLRRLVRPGKGEQGGDEALLLAVLAGFPDRVARLRADRQVLLSTGVTAELAEERPGYEFMVVLDAEDRSDRPLPVVRVTSRIEPEWLLDLFPERVREESGAEWNRAGERVEAVSSLRYHALVIEESRHGSPEPEAAAALLAEKALEKGVGAFVDEAGMEELLARIGFAGLPEPSLAAELGKLCAGLKSFAELREAAKGLPGLLEAGAPRLQELAPATVKLAGGRSTRVHYERGKPPWIGSRLQDFFGMRETPRIGRDKVPVVVHLLAPNQRAVQTTTDLAGFWERLYPEVRRGLMRRYPRHLWPEKGC